MRTGGVSDWGRRLLILLGATLLTGWVMIPLVWLMLVATLPPTHLGAQPPIIDLSRISFDRAIEFLNDPRFQSAVWVSFRVASVTTVICLVTSILAGYAIARLNMPGRRFVLGYFLATQLSAAIVLIIPTFIIMRELNLINTVTGLIILNTAFLLPWSVWLVQNFLRGVPRELELAARIDGCSRLGALFRVILPVSAPGLAAVAIIVFVLAWNEFIFALVVAPHERPVTVFLADVQYWMPGREDFAAVGTAAALTVLPALIVVTIFNRWIARGLTEGALRG